MFSDVMFQSTESKRNPQDFFITILGKIYILTMLKQFETENSEAIHIKGKSKKKINSIV